MHRRALRIITALASILAACAAASPTFAHDVPAEMRTAADRFLKSLDPNQRELCQMPFAQERRKAWHFLPSSMMQSQGGRRGLEIKRMTAQQRTFAVALLNTALSHRGQLQAATVMALETILRDIENGNPARDSELYHVAVYGSPAADHSWGWSFEGHHLSINLMLIDGQQLSVTPSFWGSNPAIVKQGPFEGLQTLATEQQLAFKLVRSLTPQQQKKAVIAAKAPRDVITGSQRQVDRKAFEPAEGIAFTALDESQQQMLLELVRAYAAKYRQPIIDQVSKRTPIIDGQGMTFAWAGGMSGGDGHYYRIQTPHFLFEYDNTQNNANHVHTVWRSFDGDFGEDLLRQHYEESPHHAGS